MPKSYPIILIFSLSFYINLLDQFYLVMPTAKFKTAFINVKDLTSLWSNLEQNWNIFWEWKIIKHLLWGSRKIKLNYWIKESTSNVGMLMLICYIVSVYGSHGLCTMSYYCGSLVHKICPIIPHNLRNTVYTLKIYSPQPRSPLLPDLRFLTYLFKT